MGAWAEEAHRLSEYLGNEHDQGVLHQALATDTSVLQAHREVGDLLPLVERRRQPYRGAAFTLGARLYAEKPGALTRRIGAYWAA